MKNIIIDKMNLEKDKPVFNEWDKTLRGTPKYESIEKYILENNILYGLAEIIETNYEIFSIGEDEKKFAFTIKLNDGQIIGFVLANPFNLTTKEPSLHLQYIVLHPDYQHQGYGTEILFELFSNPQKYFKCKPSMVFSIVDESNSSSNKLFEKFGFSTGVSVHRDLMQKKAKFKDIELAIETMSMT